MKTTPSIAIRFYNWLWHFKQINFKKGCLNILLSLTVFIVILLYGSHPIYSQTPERNILEEASIIDTEKLSQTIAKVEEKWERDYENYFRRNFPTRSLSGKAIAEDLTKISQQTGLKPAVIWAIPQDKFLRLLLVTPGNKLVKQEIRSADRVTLNRTIEQLYSAIKDRRSPRYLPPAKLIYRWLFAPLDPYLEAENIDTVLLCTGPTLRSLPFAVLHDGEQFAIEKYNLARIPAFNLTNFGYERETDKRVLAMGASQFDDKPSLPGVEVELSAITPTLWSGRQILNENFTIDRLKAEHDRGKFEIVHLATHSEFSPGSPKNSYIQFSDRALTLDQFDTLGLNEPTVDLLVLSGCQTALGDKEAEFGFAGLAMQAGVKSALASLWSINDAGTVALMSEFYQQLKLTSVKAEALRKAQLAMIEGKVSVTNGILRGSQISIALPSVLTEVEAQNLAHPFYWAGFTIIGNPW